MRALAAADLEALNKTLDGDAIKHAPPVDVDGARLDLTIEPGDDESLAHSIAALAERGIGAVVRGGGTRLGFGNAPRGARALLSTRRLTGIVEIDAEEGVAQVRAGTPLGEVRDAVAAVGWLLPFDAPGARSTLGGVLATAAIGPQHQGFGRPRDLVLGMDVVLGDGARTRCGGRVVKNVTGYDLMKVQIGAHGSFGVITAAWLRLRPRPESECTLSAVIDGDTDSIARAVAVARLASARACALVDTNFGFVVEPSRATTTGWLLLVELAGDEPAVARDALRLAADLGAEAASQGAIARLRSLQGENFGPAGLRFRVSALPSRLAAVFDALAASDAALLVYPGTGIITARIALDAVADTAGVERAWLAMRAAARAGGGSVVLEAAPSWAKAGRDVFGEPNDEWRLARALKARFDPAGILNPGRYVGGL